MGKNSTPFCSLLLHNCGHAILYSGNLDFQIAPICMVHSNSHLIKQVKKLQEGKMTVLEEAVKTLKKKTNQHVRLFAPMMILELTRHLVTYKNKMTTW